MTPPTIGGDVTGDIFDFRLSTFDLRLGFVDGTADAPLSLAVDAPMSLPMPMSRSP